jgi:hypothetical protein
LAALSTINVLPATDQHNTPITYKEFDVNNKLPSRGRNGSIYYAEDHYKTLKKNKIED